MKKRVISVLILLMYASINFAQNDLNAYKYIIVPNSYEFLKGDKDKYELNSLTQFLFEKYGFETKFENIEYPNDLLANPCLAVRADVVDKSKLFITKLVVELRDCHNKIVFTSIEGKSKQKEYKKTYQEALRNAFVSIEGLNYNYDSNSVSSNQLNSELIAPSAINVEENIETKPASIEDKYVVNNEIKPVPLPIIVEEESKKGKIDNQKFVAKSYRNENISFFLIEQNNNLVAYVNESNGDAYQKGEMIGTMFKTSIPNVYRITWKDEKGENKETTGYFDESGNLKIDVNRDGKIEVITFEVEKS